MLLLMRYVESWPDDTKSNCVQQASGWLTKSMTVKSLSWSWVLENARKMLHINWQRKSERWIDSLLKYQDIKLPTIAVRITLIMLNDAGRNENTIFSGRLF